MKYLKQLCNRGLVHSLSFVGNKIMSHVHKLDGTNDKRAEYWNANRTNNLMNKNDFPDRKHSY